MGEERRITDLTAISAFRANDYIAVDNASEAQTKKLPASAITGAISAAQTDATRALNIARSTSSFPTGDAYSSSSAYKVGDMVIYNNTLYRCKTACSPASWSVNASNFEATSLASALTDVNNDLSNKQNKSWTLIQSNINYNTVSNDVDISNYNEVNVCLNVTGDANYMYTVNIPTRYVRDYMVTGETYRFILGGYATPNAYNGSYIDCKKTGTNTVTFKNTIAYDHGVNMGSSKMYIYGR